MVSESSDAAWDQVTSAETPDLAGQMLARYRELAGLDDETRKGRLLTMARIEYALPDERLRIVTLARLRTWLALDPEQAKAIAASLDAAMREMPGTAAMRRVSMVQTLSTEFSAEDEERLREIVPGVFGGAPSRSTGLARPGAEAEPSLAVSAPARKKPFWAFWSRS